MLERAAYQTLLDWKHSTPKKALLVDGARQIGKTFLIEEFAKNEYPGHITIDFIKDSQTAELLGTAKNPRQVIERLSLLAGKEVVPGTLVFFDEVQCAPNIVTFSKYLVEDGRFDVIMSGSMLGVELGGVKSFPVGYLRIEHLYPLSFEEFCWSQGVPKSVLADIEESCRDRRPVEQAIHERLIDLFRLYIVIGGMPEAVQRYLDTSFDLGATRQVQSDLVTLYREDISKYAKDRSLQVKAIFDALPSQLAKENKRFELKSLQDQARFERYAKDFAWLVGAHAALKTVSVREPKYMLARTEEEARFKLYQSDVGMLTSRYPVSVASSVLTGAKDVNFGAVYENVVAQELAAAQCPLRYYRNSRKGEVDFLVETQEAKVLPIEVKSGKNYQMHTALNNLLDEPDFGIEEAVVLAETNVSVQGRGGKKISYLPLYMVGSIAKEVAGQVQEEQRFAPPAWD